MGLLQRLKASTKEKVRQRIETACIRFVANSLIGRNVKRSAVTSRADNNAMWYMGERLHGIANRIATGYEKDSFSLDAEQRRIAAAMRFCRGISTDLLEQNHAADLVDMPIEVNKK